MFIDAGEIFTSLKPQLCETHQKKNNEKTTHEAIGRNRVSWAIIITLNEKKNTTKRKHKLRIAIGWWWIFVASFVSCSFQRVNGRVIMFKLCQVRGIDFPDGDIKTRK